MKKRNFFNGKRATEFRDINDDVWIFGDKLENIDLSTNHLYICKDVTRYDGDIKTNLPITDGHGTREWIQGEACEIETWEILGTAAEQKIKELYICNAEEI
jgi:hypothetical protein